MGSNFIMTLIGQQSSTRYNYIVCIHIYLHFNVRTQQQSELKALSHLFKHSFFFFALLQLTPVLLPLLQVPN